MKHCLVSIDNHFFETLDGKLWTQSIVDNAFWNKYLDFFDQVTCFVRVKQVSINEVKDYILFENPRVSIVKIPMFRDTFSFIRNKFKIQKTINQVISNNTFDLAIIRVPSLLGGIVFNLLKRTEFFPIGVEVVSNMKRKNTDKFDRESIKKIIFDKQLKYIVANADGASFVTATTLQKFYKTKPGAITANYSSIDLFDDYYFSRSTRNEDKISLLHISTLNSSKKGVDMFLLVIKKLILNGYKIQGTIVGGGSLKNRYINYSKEIGVYDSVKFTGNISDKKTMRELYCENDILVFPSEFEGLPRTVIEAMATSMVCVTSNVDGLVELIENKYSHHPKDIEAFYHSIANLINDKDEYFRVSKRNFEVAKKFSNKILSSARNDFFKKLLEVKNAK